MINFENIVKKVLNESLSQMAYHFTNIYHLHKMIDTNKIRFSEVERGLNVDRLSKNNKYQYFLSTTRQRNNQVGYQHYLELDVRLTLNTDIINNKLHSEPVNFYYDSADKESSKQYYLNPNVRENDRIHQHSVESEDRIFSNVKYLYGVSDFINRIDILYNSEVYGTKKYKEMLYDILNSNVGDRVYVYDNDKDFNFQTNNVIKVA